MKSRDGKQGQSKSAAEQLITANAAVARHAPAKLPGEAHPDITPISQPRGLQGDGHGGTQCPPQLYFPEMTWNQPMNRTSNLTAHFSRTNSAGILP